MRSSCKRRVGTFYPSCSRALVHTTRKHGSLTRPVNTGCVYQVPVSTGCVDRKHRMTVLTWLVDTGRRYTLPVFVGRRHVLSAWPVNTGGQERVRKARKGRKGKGKVREGKREKMGGREGRSEGKKEGMRSGMEGNTRGKEDGGGGEGRKRTKWATGNQQVCVCVYIYVCVPACVCVNVEVEVCVDCHLCHDVLRCVIFICHFR